MNKQTKLVMVILDRPLGIVK